MRILMLSRYFPPAPGGNSTYADELARGLRERGHDVTVLVASGPEKSAEPLPDGVYVVQEPDAPRGTGEYLSAYARNALALAQKLRVRWDVVHFQEALWATAALSIGKRLDIPAVYTLCFFPDVIEARDDRYSWFHARQRASALGSAQSIAVSRTVRLQATLRYGLQENRIRVVYNGADRRRLPSAVARDRLASQPGYGFLRNADTTVVLLPARVDWKKGVDILMRSVRPIAEVCPHAHWVVCGDTPSERFLAQCVAMLQKDGVADQVTFTGPVSRTEALGWTALSALVVYPSRFEAFPYSVLEAMMLSKPVVAARVGGLGEMIANGHSGILLEAPRSEDGWRRVRTGDLVAAQVRLLQDAALCSRYGRAAEERAREEFSFERFIDGTLQAYRSAVARGPRRSS